MKPDRNRMDPELISRADRMMINQNNNIQTSIQNVHLLQNNNSKSKGELSAAAILFDENNDRGFKTTAIRHVSPDAGGRGRDQSRP
jgi:hypothetical protein